MREFHANLVRNRNAWPNVDVVADMTIRKPLNDRMKEGASPERIRV